MDSARINGKHEELMLLKSVKMGIFTKRCLPELLTTALFFSPSPPPIHQLLLRSTNVKLNEKTVNKYRLSQQLEWNKWTELKSRIKTYQFFIKSFFSFLFVGVFFNTLSFFYIPACPLKWKGR